MTSPPFKSASDLDRYLTALGAYELALTDGADEQEALEVARAAVAHKREEQVLASVGIAPPFHGGGDE